MEQRGRAVRAPLRRRRLARPDAGAPAQDRGRATTAVRVVRFTRNYGQEAAVEALYLNARGRWLIQMDGDLQHPPEEIPRLIAKKDEGYDVVYGVREGRQDTLFRVAASRAMQWGMRSMMEIELPEDVSTFRLMSAPIARLVAALPERRKFFSALLVWSGARIGTVKVKPRGPPRRVDALQLHEAPQPHLRPHRRLLEQAAPVHRHAGLRLRARRARAGRVGHRAQAALGLRAHRVAFALRRRRHPRRDAAHRDERHRRVHRAHLRAGAGAAPLQRRPSG